MERDRDGSVDEETTHVYGVFVIVYISLLSKQSRMEKIDYTPFYTEIERV